MNIAVYNLYSNTTIYPNIANNFILFTQLHFKNYGIIPITNNITLEEICHEKSGKSKEFNCISYLVRKIRLLGKNTYR